MIPAIDTNVLLDVLNQNAQFVAQSRARIEAALHQGELIVCEIVYAELASSFGDRQMLDGELAKIPVQTSECGFDVAYEAGLRWARYRAAGGPRTRMLPDFLIGAHAFVKAESFLTRDLGFFSTYFPELTPS